MGPASASSNLLLLVWAPESGAKDMSVTILLAPLYGAEGGHVKRNAPSHPLYCTDGGSYRPRYLPYSTAEFQGTRCGRNTGIQLDNQETSHGKFRGPRSSRLFLWKRFSVAKYIAWLAIGAVPVPAQRRINGKCKASGIDFQSELSSSCGMSAAY